MGAYTEIVDFTFTANETSRTFSGLSITKDDFIKVVVNFNNQSGNTTFYRLTANSETTLTNYHKQHLQGNGSGISSDRGNTPEIDAALASTTTFSIGYLKLSENDKLNVFFNNLIRADSGLLTRFNYTTSSGATFSSGITSLNFTSSQTNGFGTGSRIQIYKLAAEKVRDIIVETNSTQVDIPTTGIFDPAIDKDSEYLLVSDFNNVSGTGSGLLLTPNDLTTNSGYHAQRILGDGSSASAVRVNSPDFGGSDPNSRNLNYAHIKLSNIGAFTAQSYNIAKYGTSTPVLFNWFLSSTAVNITSITKLNIRSGVTNAIGTGSRFILYKLYE